jgi:hypothetical protein
VAGERAMPRLSLALILVGVVSVPVTWAQEPPPTSTLPDGAPTTLKIPPVATLRMGSLVVTLDGSKLPWVKRTIGRGVVSHAGDASESTYWLCYSLGAPGARQRMWLLSSGEFGGPEKTIYGVVAKAIERAVASPTCPELPAEFTPVALDLGLWLASGERDARAKLGHPSLAGGTWLHFLASRELVGDPRAAAWGGGPFYENGSVSLRLVHGHVEELWATKSAGN